MSLDLLNDLINSAKENNLVQSFVKELGEFLEKNINKNEKSILEQVQKDTKVTVKYRDKMYVERSNILNNYAKETSDKGAMYYVYSIGSSKDGTYNLSICEDGKSHETIKVKANDLPEGTGLDSVLRMKDGQYVLDSEATGEILGQIRNMTNELLEEQTQELQRYRVEGHIYEVGEKESDRVWLYDITSGDSQGIEEIDFPQDLLNEVEEGSRVEYKDGTYQKID